MTVVVVVGAVIVAVVLGLFVLAIWARRGDGLPDSSGARTVVTFRGGQEYIGANEREGEENEGSAALGEGVLTAIVGELQKRGVVVQTPDRDDYGWGVTVRLAADEAYLLLGASAEEHADWLLMAVDPSSGGPGCRALLPYVDAALQALPELSEIVWHYRDRHLAGDMASGSCSPLEPD